MPCKSFKPVLVDSNSFVITDGNDFLKLENPDEAIRAHIATRLIDIVLKYFQEKGVFNKIRVAITECEAMTKQYWQEFKLHYKANFRDPDSELKTELFRLDESDDKSWERIKSHYPLVSRSKNLGDNCMNYVDFLTKESETRMGKSKHSTRIRLKYHLPMMAAAFFLGMTFGNEDPNARNFIVFDNEEDKSLLGIIDLSRSFSIEEGEDFAVFFSSMESFISDRYPEHEYGYFNYAQLHNCCKLLYDHRGELYNLINDSLQADILYFAANGFNQKIAFDILIDNHKIRQQQAESFLVLRPKLIVKTQEFINLQTFVQYILAQQQQRLENLGEIADLCYRKAESLQQIHEYSDDEYDNNTIAERDEISRGLGILGPQSPDLFNISSIEPFSPFCDRSIDLSPSSKGAKFSHNLSNDNVTPSSLFGDNYDENCNYSPKRAPGELLVTTDRSAGRSTAGRVFHSISPVISRETSLNSTCLLDEAPAKKTISTGQHFLPCSSNRTFLGYDGYDKNQVDVGDGCRKNLFF